MLILIILIVTIIPVSIISTMSTHLTFGEIWRVRSRRGSARPWSWSTRGHGLGFRGLGFGGLGL